MSQTRDSLHKDIKRLIAEAQVQLGLGSWRIITRFDLSGEIYADCDASHPEYEHATLRFNARRLRKEKFNQKDLWFVVIHELLHVALWELSSIERDSEHYRTAEERIVQRLTRALTEEW